MKRIIRYAAILPLLLIFTSAWAHPAKNSREVSLDQEFDLKVGERATLEGTGLEISFERVAEDSRCPRNVKCVWAGNGKVVVGLRAPRGRRGQLSLNTTLKPNQDSFRGYEVKLVKLDPYPEKDAKIKKRDYVATLVVSRK